MEQIHVHHAIKGRHKWCSWELDLLVFDASKTVDALQTPSIVVDTGLVKDALWNLVAAFMHTPLKYLKS